MRARHVLWKIMRLCVILFPFWRDCEKWFSGKLIFTNFLIIVFDQYEEFMQFQNHHAVMQHLYGTMMNGVQIVKL